MRNELAQSEGSIDVVRRLEWAGLPQGWGAVVMLLIAAGLLFAVTWLYRREERRGAGVRVRWFLAGLRCVVMAMLLAIWLEPVIAMYLRRRIESHTMVLVDTSGSMRIRDRYREGDEAARWRGVVGDAAIGGGLERLGLAKQMLLKDDAEFIKALTKRNRVDLFSFGQDGQNVLTLDADRDGAGESLNNEQRGAIDSLEAAGAATNLGRSLRRAVESLGGEPLSGIVILSDGGLNQGEPADIIGRFARSKGAPVYTVGIGNPTPPRNVRVTHVLAASTVFQRDPFVVTAQLAADGMPGAALKVELLEQPAQGGTARPVAQQEVPVGPDGSIAPVTFQHTAAQSGSFIYRVQAEIQPDEVLTDDNGQQTTVQVIDNKMRVLLVAGSPSWDYRYLSRLLERDATVEMSAWLQSADVEAVRDGNVVITQLPATEKELFAYDVVVLMDPDPATLPPEWARMLSRMVSDYGGGVLYAAARKFTPKLMRDEAFRPLLDLMPVSMDPDADLLLNELGHYQKTGWSVAVPPESAGHPILALEGQGRSGPEAWSQLNGVFWHFPTYREKPAATVLMRHSNPRMQNAFGPHVLMASQIVGAGRSLFLGFDGSWRWRGHGEELVNRFWIRMLRYLMEGKLLNSRKRIVLLSEQDTVEVGETVALTARLLDVNYKPIENETVIAYVTTPGGNKLEVGLSGSPGRQGWYRGEFVASQTGVYRVTLRSPVTVGDPVEAVKDIQANPSDLEIQRPELDRDTLRVLAEQSAGGRYFDMNEYAEIASLIEDRHSELEIPGRPETLWDRWPVLAILIVLLGVEWAVRKQSQLL
jgi:hypothetical protein